MVSPGIEEVDPAESGIAIVGDFFVDMETGETIGPASKPQQWVPEDAGDVDFVLSLFAEADADVLAIDARLKALSENLQSQKRDIERRKASLEYKYRNPIEAIARRELEGKKERTLKLDHGQVSFRKTQGTCKIIAMDIAVEWAEKHKPDSVVIEKSVLASTIKDDAPEDALWLERTPSEDRMSIKTGVKPPPAPST